jgi:predicted nucleic acid-binding protein
VRQRYAQEHGIFTFTSVTVYEIVYGLELKAASAQLTKAFAWLNQNEQITPNNADYVLAATTKAAARRKGFTLELPDCLIAAVARSSRPAPCDRQHRRLSGHPKNRGQPDHRKLARSIAFSVRS